VTLCVPLWDMYLLLLCVPCALQVDTNLPSPADVVIVEGAEGALKPQEMLPIKGKYNVAPFSAIVLMAV